MSSAKRVVYSRRCFFRALPGTVSGIGVAATLMAQGAGTDAIPPYLSSEEARKTLPQTLPPGTFREPDVVRAYKIARSIPAVLAQQPCYCWCSRMGHHSLLSCYVDDHASACDMCMKEAFLSDQMTRNGKSPAEIRAAIVRGEWKNAR